MNVLPEIIVIHAGECAFDIRHSALEHFFHWNISIGVNINKSNCDDCIINNSKQTRNLRLIFLAHVMYLFKAVLSMIDVCTFRSFGARVSVDHT